MGTASIQRHYKDNKEIIPLLHILAKQGTGLLSLLVQTPNKSISHLAPMQSLSS